MESGKVEYKIHQINTHNAKFSNYCYLIEDLNNKKAVLIDPAWEQERFESLIEKDHVHLEAVLLTHSHIDHINLADYFSEKYQVNVYISRKEADTYGFSCPNLNYLNHGDELNIWDLTIKCFLIPGHTQGSMCFQLGNNLFVGDTIFYEGCGKCNYSNRSIKEMYESIQFIKCNFSDDTYVFSGHVYYMSTGQQLEQIKRNNYSFFLDESKFVEYQRNMLLRVQEEVQK